MEQENMLAEEGINRPSEASETGNNIPQNESAVIAESEQAVPQALPDIDFSTLTTEEIVTKPGEQLSPATTQRNHGQYSGNL